MVLLTKKELANAAGYTYRRLYDIDKELPEGKKLFVEGEKGKCDLAAFVQNWVEYNLANATNGHADLNEVKARHELVKLEKTRLEVERLRGYLVDVCEVRNLWAEIAATVTQNLLRLPGKMAPILESAKDAREIEQELDREVRATLEAIADTPVPRDAAEEVE